MTKVEGRPFVQTVFARNIVAKKKGAQSLDWAPKSLAGYGLHSRLPLETGLRLLASDDPHGACSGGEQIIFGDGICKRMLTAAQEY